MKNGFSLIVPCYNEEGYLLDSYIKVSRELQKNGIPYEIIFIDDKSEDETRNIILQICKLDKKARYIFHKTNVGRGATVSEGIIKAENDIVGFLDIDLEVSEKYIGKFINKIKDGCDLVIAKRKYKVNLGSLTRSITSKSYILIQKILLGSKFDDTEAGYKFFNKKRILPILKLINNKRWFWDTEIVLLSYLNGLKIGEIDVIFNRRSDKKSTVKLIPDSLDYLINLVKFKKRIVSNNINIEGFWKSIPAEFNQSYTSKSKFRYFVNYFLNLRMNKIINLLKGIDLEGKKVLDVGCGGGQYMEYFLNKNAEIVGIDYSEKMIEMAKAYLGDKKKDNKKFKYTLLKADAKKLPFLSNTFDLVVGIGLLEYLSKPQKALSEIHRVLKEDSYALLSFSKKESPFFLLRIFPGSILRNILFKLPQLTTVFSLKDTKLFLENNHLKLLKIDEVLYTEYLALCKKRKYKK